MSISYLFQVCRSQFIEYRTALSLIFHDIFVSASTEDSVQKIKPGLFSILILLALALFFSLAGKVSASRVEAVTVVPVSVGQMIVTPAPSDSPTPVATDEPTSGPPLSLTLTLVFTCCALGLVVGVIVLGFILSMQKRKEEKKDKSS